MGILSNFWNRTVGSLLGCIEPRAYNSFYYIYNGILTSAVAPIPHNASEAHSNTAKKWEELAGWIQKSGSYTNAEEGKAALGLMGLHIDNVAQAIKLQKGKPFIEIDREDLDYIHKNAAYFLESIRYYQPRFSDNNTNVIDLNNTIKLFNRHTGVQPPEIDPAYPDKSGYIRHFYQTMIRDLDLKPIPKKTYSL